MPIRFTPKQNQERHHVDQLNGRIHQSGQDLRSNQDLDKKWYTNQSWDTRNDLSKLGDAHQERAKIKQQLSKRLTDLNASPKDKEHASRLLRSIDQSESRERREQITGGSGRYSSKDIRTDHNGLLRYI